MTTRAKLFGVALRILRRCDLAEEVIQDAYVEIWHNAGQFKPAQWSPITWTASIARNRAIDAVRKRGESSIEEELTAAPAADRSDPSARQQMTEARAASGVQSGDSSRIARSSCCWPTTTAGAASNRRRIFLCPSTP